MEMNLLKLRSDRKDNFDLYENDRYYCVIRNTTGTALYNKKTNELVRAFTELQYVVCAGFAETELLVLKTINGVYFTYDIGKNELVRKRKYFKHTGNQERKFQIMPDGMIYDIDQALTPQTAEEDICRLIKIDLQANMFTEYKLENVPRSAKLRKGSEKNQLIIKSWSHLWSLDIYEMVPKLLPGPRDCSEGFSIEGFAIEGCNQYGDMVITRGIRTDGDYIVFGLYYYNVKSNEEVFLDEYKKPTSQAILERRPASKEINHLIFFHAMFDNSGRYIVLQYGHAGIKVFDTDKREFVYVNLGMKYLWRVSMGESRIYISENKTIYYLDVT